MPCSGWMNVRRDVAVLDQALAERDPGRAREADRGRRARVGDRQHEVGLDRRLLGEPLAHPHARAVHLDAGEPRVGPGEVEELEDAERAALGRAASTCIDVLAVRRRRATSSPGPDLALERGADEVERAGLGGDDRVVAEPPEHERPEAVRGRGTRTACPSARPTTVAAPSSRSIAPATASSSGRSSFAISAAITSLSEVDASRTPASSSRSSSALIRLPLCPSATVRARPWWSSGCAFAHAFEPVVE